MSGVNVLFLAARTSEHGNIIEFIGIMGKRSEPLSMVFNGQPRDIYIIESERA